MPPTTSEFAVQVPASQPHVARHPIGLRLIALFKLFGGALLASVGLAAVRLLDPELGARFMEWVRGIALDTDRRVVQHAAEALLGLSARKLGGIAVAAFAYSGLLLTEGVGLWYAQRWAEWLTVAVTASLLPFEGWALTHRVTLVRVVALVVNVAIVVYLVRELRRRPVHEAR